MTKQKPEPFNDENAHAPGKKGAGESGGGAYPNPHSGKDGGDHGLLGHGGQTDIFEKQPGATIGSPAEDD